MNWGSFFSGLGNLGVSIAQAVNMGNVPQVIPGAPAGTLYLPSSGTVVSPGAVINSSGQVIPTSAVGSSSLLILIVAAVALVLVLRK